MENNQTPQICKDCQGEFTLTESELKFYQGMIAEKPEFQMPKRCGKCRTIKKKERALERGPVSQVQPRGRREWPKNDTIKKDPDEFVNGL